MDTETEKIDQSTLCCYEGMITYDFWKSSIKCHAHKSIQKKIEEYVEKTYDDEDDDMFLEFRMIYLSNNNRPGSYDELWFIDIDLKSGYAPVYITDVSGSSYHAMSMCSIVDEEHSERLTVDQILDLGNFVDPKPLERILNDQFKN